MVQCTVPLLASGFYQVQLLKANGEAAVDPNHVAGFLYSVEVDSVEVRACVPCVWQPSFC